MPRAFISRRRAARQRGLRMPRPPTPYIDNWILWSQEIARELSEVFILLFSWPLSIRLLKPGEALRLAARCHRLLSQSPYVNTIVNKNKHWQR
jgi:hypothetical protein